MKGDLMSPVDAEIQGDVFHFRRGIPDAAQLMKMNGARHLATLHVSDDEDLLQLVASTPSPPIGLMIGPIFAASAMLTSLIVLGMALILLSEVRLEIPAPLFVGLGIMCLMLAPVAFVWVLMRFTARNHCRIYAHDSADTPLLELRPSIQFLGLATIYELWSNQGKLLATLHENHVYNVFYPRRWCGVHPDGSVWFVVREDTVVPNGIRIAMGTRAVNILPTPDCLILGPDHKTMLARMKRAPWGSAANVLEMSADRDHAIDRRVAVTLGVFLEFNRHSFPNASG